ncbi:MAG: aldo/keto reductase [Anaerovoracaceae bacterium]|jgi:methylglyoxal reductase
MKYRNLGKTDLNASVVAFGAWGLGGGSVWEDTNEQDSVGNLLDAAYDCGINYIDTAPVYGMGTSEERLGEALKTRRNRFLLQTKCSLNWRENGGNFHYTRDGYTVYNNTGADAIKKDVEGSLKRLQTDHIDVLVVHYVCRDWPAEETMRGLEDLIREGKIRAVGISNSQPADLDAYAAAGDVALVQEQFSLLAPFHGREYFDTCSKYGTTFQVYGVLEEGYLTGPEPFRKSYGKADIRARLPWLNEPYKSGILKLYDEVWKPMCEKYGCSYANLFEAWTLSQYDNLSLLTGFRRRKTIEDTVKCFDVRLEEDDIRTLNETVKPVQVDKVDK